MSHAEQVVNEVFQQSSSTGTTNNSATSGTSQPPVKNEGGLGSIPQKQPEGQSVNLTTEELVKFHQWIADSKKRNVADILKGMKSNVNARRQTMVLRRVDSKIIAPDEDVAAYQRIHELKNPSGDPKNKTFVSDNEINAYKVLDPRFDSIPTLTEIAAKVESMKAAGQLTAEGDKDSSEEE